MSEAFTLNTTVTFWNVDREQKLSLPGVFKLLQEGAIKHADLYDVGSHAMLTRGESWVLNRIVAQIHRYPSYEEELRLVTWSTGIKGFKGYRDFRVFRGDEPILSASSLWLYVNIRSKSLTRVPKELADAFPAKQEEAFYPDLDRLRVEPPSENAASVDLSLRYTDIDGNNHVNNAAYFDLLQSALARTGLPVRPGRLAVHFQKEIPAAVPSVQVALEKRGADEVAFGIRGPEGLCAQGWTASA